MKAILISIKPKWVAKILNGEKTIEIRKTCPQLFKNLKPYEGCSIDVYIYCTKEDSLCCIKRIDRDRYICEKDFDLRDFPHLSSGYDGKGKVVAKFTLNKVQEIEVGTKENTEQKDYSTFYSSIDEMKLCKASCLDAYEILKYAGYCDDFLRPYKYKVYAWHIDNLEIFDKARELSEFKKCQLLWTCVPYNCQECPTLVRLTKAPQNFCYVEVE